MRHGFYHKQTDITRETGNCIQACVATILDISLGSVPNFKVEDKPILALECWLQANGWGLISFKPECFQSTMGVIGIAAVPSERHVKGLHAVVFRVDRKGDIQMFWNPDPESKLRYYTMELDTIKHMYVIVPNGTRY